MRSIVSIVVVVALALASVMSISGVALAVDEGSIQGYVYEEDGTTPISVAVVYAYEYSVDVTLGPNSASGSAYASIDGSYIISDLASGDYRVKAEADGYFSEYYNNVPDSASATQVAVTSPDPTTGIDFSLTKGGSISGFVYQAGGVTPITTGHVIAYDNTTGQMVDDGWTDEYGSYSVGNNMYSGNYLVKAEADGYFSEYYNNVPDSASATPVPVTAPNPTTGIDFTLTAGGSISGVVYTDNGTPIDNARVIAYNDIDGIVDEGWSRPDGRYTVGNNLDSGNYRVGADMDGYYSEYYDNVTSLDAATPVTVTAPNDTPDINFSLSVQTLLISDVIANATGETTATITWTTDELATSMVEYGLALGDYPLRTTDNTTLVTGHIVDLTGLTASTTYHYRVVSTNASDLQGRSLDYTFTTPDLTAPEISEVSATVTGETTATITWNTDESAESQVEYGTSASYGEITTLDTNLVTSHIVNLTGLTPGTTYYYKVKSRDTLGSGLWAESGGHTFTTLDITTPVISAVSASNITTTSATITWTTGEAATSQVEYGPTTAYGSATTIDTNLLTSHSVSLTALTAGTTYHYRVKSRDVSNNEAISADFTFTTATVPAPDTTPPSTPVVTDDGASTTDLTQLHATWTSSDAESGIVEYQYAIGTSAGGNDVVDWTSVGTATQVTKTGLNLSVGTTYYFSVKVQNGQELWSDVGTSDGIQVEEVPPEQPSDGGGFPVWAWVIIGIAGAAALGGLGYWLIKGMPQQPKQQ